MRYHTTRHHQAIVNNLNGGRGSANRPSAAVARSAAEAGRSRARNAVQQQRRRPLEPQLFLGPRLTSPARRKHHSPRAADNKKKGGDRNISRFSVFEGFQASFKRREQGASARGWLADQSIRREPLEVGGAPPHRTPADGPARKGGARRARQQQVWSTPTTSVPATAARHLDAWCRLVKLAGGVDRYASKLA